MEAAHLPATEPEKHPLDVLQSAVLGAVSYFNTRPAADRRPNVEAAIDELQHAAGELIIDANSQFDSGPEQQ